MGWRPPLLGYGPLMSCFQKRSQCCGGRGGHGGHAPKHFEALLWGPQVGETLGKRGHKRLIRTTHEALRRRCDARNL